MRWIGFITYAIKFSRRTATCGCFMKFFAKVAITCILELQGLVQIRTVRRLVVEKMLYFLKKTRNYAVYRIVLMNAALLTA